MPTKRIGIFGGTFDPPHLGHLILAEEIREDFGLDEVYFMPCNEPPHKDRPDLTAAKHRFAMVVAGTLHNSTFVASPIEVNRTGKSYSIDTVRMLRDEVSSDTELLFITGLDSFLEIETWKDYEELLDLCHTIVVSRPGHRFDEIRERLPEWIVERLVDTRAGGVDPRAHLGTTAKPIAVPTGSESGSGSASGSANGDAGERERSSRWRIFLSNKVHIDISSTEIRERIRAGRSIRYRVPAEVERYIEANGLYRVPSRAEEAAS